MRIKAKVKGDLVEVKLIAKHPMETGFAKDKEGKLIPAHYIEELSAKVEGEQIFTSYLGPAISKNPYLKFYYKGKKGDVVVLRWIDNQGKEETKEKIVE